MNVKARKTKKQVNVENQTINLLTKEELRKKVEVVEKILNHIPGGNWKPTINLQRMTSFPSSQTTCLLQDAI